MMIISFNRGFRLNIFYTTQTSPQSRKYSLYFLLMHNSIYKSKKVLNTNYRNGSYSCRTLAETVFTFRMDMDLPKVM